MCIISEISSIISQNSKRPRDRDHAPFRLGLAMLNMRTKFEVSAFIHYKDMKDNTAQNGEIGVVCGLRSVKVTNNVTIR